MYTIRDLRYGCEILRPDGTSCAFLQGDEAYELMETVAIAQLNWAEDGADNVTIARHTDYMLSQYDYGE